MLTGLHCRLAGLFGFPVGRHRVTRDAALPARRQARCMAHVHAHDDDRTPFERRVTVAAFAAAPILAGLGVIAMLISPEVFAASEESTGAGLWIGALFGLAMFLAFVALPPLLFGLALRSGRGRWLTATLIGAPALALYMGLLPLIGAILGGWDGVSPLAVLAAAAAAVLEGFVFAAALRAQGRLGRRPKPA